ncbi:hypothetical protein NDU88_004583 [Pleurodeles waltl]|uniref:Uncharacterized protein n=1 Tax=Pleurodeles waltl TaxID=8319 RepID=A0AAV7WA62_PLEWA|nr:hypothetical protein NDU88_004583 [Pleurodeles waltl]
MSDADKVELVVQLLWEVGRLDLLAAGDLQGAWPTWKAPDGVAAMVVACSPLLIAAATRMQVSNPKRAGMRLALQLPLDDHVAAKVCHMQTAGRRMFMEAEREPQELEQCGEVLQLQEGGGAKVNAWAAAGKAWGCLKSNARAAQREIKGEGREEGRWMYAASSSWEGLVARSDTATGQAGYDNIEDDNWRQNISLDAAGWLDKAPASAKGMLQGISGRRGQGCQQEGSIEMGLGSQGQKRAECSLVQGPDSVLVAALLEWSNEGEEEDLGEGQQDAGEEEVGG